MGRYTPQTPCAPRAAKHPLRVCSAPRSLKYPRRKEVPPIDFCHIPVSIIKRSEGRSAVAAAAYRSGTKLTNEWDGLTHDYTRKGGIVHAEIMLPAHAPPEFADRSTLWNSVEQIEKARDSQLAREIEAALPRELSREQQLALVRAYVKENFVDKGMCADFAIHDKGTGNPHVHIMLTVRPLKENGAWGAKCRKAYDLDENGQRIPDGKGGWKNHREDTTDWNDKGNVEIWRAAWAAYTNRALEAAGQPALVDHRSYKRQGIDKIPSVHLGPAASQMEKRGIRTAACIAACAAGRGIVIDRSTADLAALYIRRHDDRAAAACHCAVFRHARRKAGLRTMREHWLDTGNIRRQQLARTQHIRRSRSKFGRHKGTVLAEVDIDFVVTDHRHRLY